MTDVIMPQMGESIAEGTITKWLKQLGDRVERDEPLFEISTDKVDAEIPAPAAGVLSEIRVPPGATVPINTVVGVISAQGEAAVTPAAATAAPAPERDLAAVPAPIETPTADPAAAAPSPVALPSPAPAQAPQAIAAASAPVAPTTGSAAADSSGPAAPAGPPRSEPTIDELRQTRSSPVVRRIAAEHGVDISQIPGSGISGRVTKQDILGHLEGRSGQAAPERVGAPLATPAAEPVAGPAAATAPEPAASEAPVVPSMPAYQPGERVEVVPMSPIRKRTAEHMVTSKRISAHVSTVFEVELTRVDQLRKAQGPAFLERSGIKLTYLPFIIKATVDALKAFPVLNASVAGDSVVYKKDINVGIAVALDWGLIVPVIRNADERNLLGLARAVTDLAQRARSRKLKVDEVQGGTFTITNPGVFGSLFGTPIINQPQVAILGVGTIEKRPVVRDDAIAIRTMAYFALSFDHRIVDGADADRFMAHLKKGLQEFDEAAL